MRRPIAAIVGAALLTVTITACAGASTPEVTPAPKSAATAEAPEPTAEPTPEVVAPTAGTREAPLHVGEARKLSTESAWTVSAAATEVHEGYVVLPLTIGLDWPNLQAQAVANGYSESDPTNPYLSLIVKFVAADGRTYDTMENYQVTVPNQLFEVGDVYPPTDSVFGNVPVSVPNEQVPGGVWSVENTGGKRVFLAQS